MKILLILSILLTLVNCRETKQEGDYLDLTLRGKGNKVVLHWSCNDPEVAGYIVKWGEQGKDYKVGQRNLYPTLDPPVIGMRDAWKRRDVGMKTTMTFLVPLNTFWRFQVFAYDFKKRGSHTPVRYYPRQVVYEPLFRSNFDGLEDCYSDHSCVDLKEWIPGSPWHGYLYKTGAPINIVWNHDFINLSYFRIRAVYIDDDAHHTEYIIGTTPNNSYTFARPSMVGMYRISAQACNAANLCSTWSNSDDSNVSVVSVDGQTISGEWLVYWRLSPPVWE